MASNYDNSAWFYDRLSKVIFGQALVNAQLYLLKNIPPKSKILIAGGGTGWILEEIAKIHPAGLKITYVEISSKMMALSQKRICGDNELVFINQAVENTILSSDYNVVITPFLLDNFTEENLSKIFGHIHNSLKPGGLWLNTDFRLTGKWWQKILLGSMLLFFRMICGIESKNLPNIENYFEAYGYKVVTQKSLYGDFILSTVWEKVRN
jgi:ubiquinone/menaquinone biosynthesis C-methylase UbiE